MSRSLLAAGVLNHRDANGRVIVALANFQNRTSVYAFDPNLLYNRVKAVLNGSGFVFSYVQDNEPLTHVQANRSRATLAANNAQAQARNELLEFTGSAHREELRSAVLGTQYVLAIEVFEDTSTAAHAARMRFVLQHAVDGVVWENERAISGAGHR